jgi:mevalonate kinase
MKKIWSAPGKVFLLGEYAVLAGGPAWVAAFSPRFSISESAFEWQGWSSSPLLFHPESPAGKFLSSRAFPLSAPLHGVDPWKGAGGFGASSAHVVLLEKMSGTALEFNSPQLRQAWERYRGLGSRPGELPPSGADFLAQALGGVVWFEPEGFGVRQVGEILNQQKAQLQIRVIQASLQAGRKVATHEHLRKLSAQGGGFLSELRQRLSPITQDGWIALHAGDALGFGQALSRYGDALAALDLEDGATRRDRQILAKLPGVLGIKGTGALQADALVAAIDPLGWDPAIWQKTLSQMDLVDVGEITGLERGAQ